MADGRGDGELVEAARKGDSSAWDVLVTRHSGRLWAVARAHRLGTADAEDVFQVTWLRLVTHLDTIRDPDRVGAWLATTARHECLRLLRRAGRAVPSGDTDDLEQPDPKAPSVDARMLAGERDVALLAALDLLPERCRRLLRVLMADPGPTYEEVSAALGMPVGSIGPTRQRCLSRLRHELGGI
ncbi:MAG: sigma-70 family RNA polymerase sigma factor [Actinobacteria bacterium]|nr:sigma-70 family RNA polymerase sigma factor [Actinomycetota bacterium]